AGKMTAKRYSRLMVKGGEDCAAATCDQSATIAANRNAAARTTAVRSGIQRLDFNERGLVMVAGPERAGGLVHVDATNVRLARQEVIHHLSGVDVQAGDMVVGHAAGP